MTKMTLRVLISDKMSDEGLGYFKEQTAFETVYKPEITMEQLGEEVGEYDALVIRSRTTVTADMLKKHGKLRIIGRAGAGTDNIDKTAATQKGIIVMNTPGANTFSTAEHAMAMMMSLARQIPQAHATMAAGKWAKKDFVGVELYQKTLGILGLGKIGRVVAERMKGFEMRILAYDPFLTKETADEIGVELADVDTICEQADFITIHAPKNEETSGLINTERLKKMKKTTMIVNCARGGIVDEVALAEALGNGTIAGAALDVFATEPLAEDSPLRKLPNLVMTPHLAATTGEAQENVSKEMAAQVAEALTGGPVRNAVNAPSVDPATLKRIAPALDLCQRLGKFISQLCTPPIKAIDITYSGTKAKHPSDALTTRLLCGLLENNFSDPINDVNAHVVAKQLGLHISETRSDDTGTMYTGLVTVSAKQENGETITVSGALNMQRQPRIVIINQKHIEADPAGHMLVLENEDRPGIVGAVATVIGKHNINIASMGWGRVERGTNAVTIINVDDPVTAEVVKEITALKGIVMAKAITI